ncbi:MAG TPA: mycofactocin biosynthesis peptidyl-dipeptidase MftE [Acidimicrobiales bacterium]|nr:mycofactocin biosynthesis peptidyl-dipeptidase MftE [Acidimicrobiales bacterium]
MTRTRRLADMTWPEVADLRDRAVLAVPVGATEQHGPHLALSTDTDLAVALCARLAAARPGVLAAPPVCYGSSGEHQSFPGTLSIGRDALQLLLVELGRSATCTFAGVVLVSTHGGNAAAVIAAERRLRAEGRAVLAWMPRWDGDAHAGRTETSVQLALAPGSVRLDRAAAGDTRPLAAVLPALRAGGVASVSPNGVLGDPAGATAAEGRAVVAGLADDLVRRFDGWLAGAGEPAGPGRGAVRAGATGAGEG